MSAPWDQFHDWSINQDVDKMSKNCEFKGTSTNCFLSPTNCPKPEDSSFILRKNKEKQQIFIFKKLETSKTLDVYLLLN